MLRNKARIKFIGLAALLFVISAIAIRSYIVQSLPNLIPMPYYNTDFIMGSFDDTKIYLPGPSIFDTTTNQGVARTDNFTWYHPSRISDAVWVMDNAGAVVRKLDAPRSRSCRQSL